MGANTVAEIIAEGTSLAGRDDTTVTTKALGWLNKWLRSQYQAWPWPFLIQRRSGLALVAGTQSILVGGGNSGITHQIKKVEDSFFLRTSDFGGRYRPRIMNSTNVPLELDPDMQNTTTQRGPPERIQVRAGTSPTNGVWQLIFYPTPDRAYLLNFDYQFLPAAHTVTSDIPLYPNDQTMVQLIAGKTRQFADGLDDPAAVAALDVAAAMAIDDRTKSGQIPGTNDVWGLDGGVFS